MASQRQINANRCNAQKSTGPTSPEGREASKRNGLTHGLTATEVFTEEDLAVIEQRSADWRKDYRLGSDGLEWHFEQMVAESVLLDRCRGHLEVLRREEMLNARANWDVERSREAEDLGEILGDEPGPVSLRLQETRQGVEWMIERWRDLGLVFEYQEYWTKGQIALALDLLGVSHVLRAANPGIEDPAALVEEQVAKLEGRLSAGLVALDDFRRKAAEAGMSTAAPSKALSNARRYEAACLRRFRAAEKKLEPYRKPATPAAPEPPQPAPEPICKTEASGDLGKPGEPQQPSAVPPAPASALATPEPVGLPSFERGMHQNGGDQAASLTVARGGALDVGVRPS